MADNNPDNVPDLPVRKVNQILSDEDCPHVSVLIPCYLRREFVPLIITNLIQMDYPKSKLEICILQDGPEDLLVESERDFFKMKTGCRLNYKYEPGIRRTIGEKRNRLVKMASHKICANMDSDDIYLSTYIRYSVSALKEFKVGITTSASMLFIYPKLNYKLTGIRCGHKHQGHEAAAVFTKKHFNAMGGFVSKGEHGNQGEGVKMIQYNEKQMVNLDVRYLMCCVVHDGNTINKDRFVDAHIDGDFTKCRQVNCLRQILGEIDNEDAPLDI